VSQSDVTKIQWTDRTWNPWWGCNKIAPECDHCYAATFASRALHTAHAGVAEGGEWTGEITRGSPSVWQAPFKFPAGSLVFACSMSEFWHERVPLQWLDEALSVIEATPDLTYQILSKRPGNIARKLSDLNRRLPDNVWLGATIGHSQSLPLLKPMLRLDASVRFLSVEPLLTPVVPGLDLDGIGWVIRWRRERTQCPSLRSRLDACGARSMWRERRAVLLKAMGDLGEQPNTPGTGTRPGR
jgi:protein gp37